MIDLDYDVVPHLSSGIVERAKSERARARKKKRKKKEKRKKKRRHAVVITFFSLPATCRLFSRGAIFTHARVSLALLSLRTNGGLLVVYD